MDMITRHELDTKDAQSYIRAIDGEPDYDLRINGDWIIGTDKGAQFRFCAVKTAAMLYRARNRKY